MLNIIKFIIFGVDGIQGMQFGSQILYFRGKFKRHIKQQSYLIQQLMKKRKQQDSTIMQQAIEKASQLINLLQKENSDLKKKVQAQDVELKNLGKTIIDLQTHNGQIQIQYSELQSQSEQLRRELQVVNNQFEKCQQNFRRKSQTNKELHEKISILNATLKQKNKQLTQQKRQMLSLQNQNNYLLKKLGQWEAKDSSVDKRIIQIQSNHEKQLKEIIKIKEAFSRRCEDLKIDNAILTEKAAEYKQCLIQSQCSNNLKSGRVCHQIPREEKGDIKDYYQIQLQKVLKQKLGVIPEASYQGKIEQIGSFLGYRLGHIQKMCEGIAQKLKLKQWDKLQNIKDLNTTCLRLYSYTSQLLNKPI